MTVCFTTIRESDVAYTQHTIRQKILDWKNGLVKGFCERSFNRPLYLSLFWCVRACGFNEFQLAKSMSRLENRRHSLSGPFLETFLSGPSLAGLFQLFGKVQLTNNYARSLVCRDMWNHHKAQYQKRNTLRFGPLALVIVQHDDKCTRDALSKNVVRLLPQI